MKIYNNISELVGNTPMVRLNKFTDENDANIYLKLESFNPGSSVKDRIALGMIKDAEEKGLLKEGYTIVEPTSGNTGIGIAMIGAQRGYKVIITMPESMSIERRKIIKAFAAELVLTEASKGMKGAIQKADELAATNSTYFRPRQFDNPANPMTHVNTTALEIIEQMDSKIDCFVAGVGTGGTITGCGKTLKKEIPNIKIVAVEPSSSPVLSGGNSGPHKIQGIGAGFKPSILDTSIFDEVVTVSNEVAFDYAKEVVGKEGIFIGISSGAAISVAIKKAKELGKGKNIVVIVPSYGERYLSVEGLFDK